MGYRTIRESKRYHLTAEFPINYHRRDIRALRVRILPQVWLETIVGTT